MISELEKRALRDIKKEIISDYNSAGGGWTVDQILRGVAKRRKLTPEQEEYLKVDLIKAIPDYRG